MRLYNFIKGQYNLTKSEVKDFYLNHKIYVNDSKASLTTIIDNDSKIVIDDKEVLIKKEDIIFIAFNKPVGVECTNDINNLNSIINYIGLDKRVVPIGRLDKDSHGLIILTNDLKACNEFLNKDNHVEKEYIVKTKEEIDLEFIEKISKPQFILNKYSKECIVKYIDNHTFNIILKEGMNRQIRRMAKNLGKTVIDLERIRFGNYKLSEPVGKYKYITKDSI